MGIIREETLKILSAMRKQAVFESLKNTDEQALEVTVLYPEWGEIADGTELEAGLRVRYNGVLYRVNDGQTHKKQADWSPENAPSLFSEVLIPDESVATDWKQPNSENGYLKGQRVTHKGFVWESNFDGKNTWEPGVVGTENLWINVGEV